MGEEDSPWVQKCDKSGWSRCVMYYNSLLLSFSLACVADVIFLQLVTKGLVSSAAQATFSFARKFLWCI